MSGTRMVSGFHKSEDFAPVIGWELFQVTLDKLHVMFFFENGWRLLNVAHSFSHRSSDGAIDYSYELYGAHKRLELDRLLRLRVTSVQVLSADRLALVFENGDQLVIHDDPEMRSWWFTPVRDPDYPEKALSWALSDEECY